MDQVLEKFKEKFPIPIGCNKNPYIILLDGYTGMGKSTVSNLLSRFSDAIILNNDEVRKFLGDYEDQTGLKTQLQRYWLEELLKNGNNCILDSCFCHRYQEKLKYVKSLGYRYYIIRLECSDEIVRLRLSKRVLGEKNYSIATYDDYLWMKNCVERVPLELINYTIYTEEELIPQVKVFLSMVKENNFSK